MIKPIIIKEKAVHNDEINTFRASLSAEGIHITDFHIKMLLSRGISDPLKAKNFLTPSTDTMYDPFLLKGMTLAVDKIKGMVDSGDKITIYGDYDVDGITSTSILYKMLSHIGANVDYYIPDRLEEGYGINTKALGKLKETGSSLVISVDTGITAVEQVEYAKEIGLDVIITDHHECQEVIPDALAVINPKQSDCSYPYDMLAGCGVTYKLIQGLGLAFGTDDMFLSDLLEIVAVGTISDLVPLVDENRTFVYQAFSNIMKKGIKNIGLSALFKVAELDPEKLSAGMIGFQVGPRLNAAGRLGDAKRGVKLFLSENMEDATKIAEELNVENQNRRLMEESILKEADELIGKHIDVKNSKVLVVAHEGWHHGVIGIVASRIMEKYYRPTILLAIEDGVASGSARSVDGFSIFDALSSTKQLLDKFGGHEMAAGMSLDANKLDELSFNLNKFADENMDEETLVRKVKVEDRVVPSDITVDFIESLSVFEPYGMGNEEPKFVMEGKVSSMSLMGKDKNHFKMQVSDGDKVIDTIGFFAGEYYDDLSYNQKVRAIGTLNVNEWKSFKKPQLFLKSITYDDSFNNIAVCLRDVAEVLFNRHSIKNDLNKNEVIEILGKMEYNDKELDKELKLDRNYCAKVYKSLIKKSTMEEHKLYLVKIGELNETSIMDSDYNIMSLKNLLVLRVFEELELMKINYSDDGYLEFTMFSGKKVELQKSTLYNSMC